MIDKKNASLILPSVFVIFIDAISRSLAYPLILILVLSKTASILPPDTPMSKRFLYLSILMMLNPVFKLLGTNYLGNISDIIKRRITLMITTLGLSFAFILAGIGVTIKSFLVFAIARCLMGLFAGSKSVAMAAIVDSVPSDERARSLAFANFGYVFGNIIGPLLAGILSDQKLSPIFSMSFPFYISGVISIISFLWVAFWYPDTFGHKIRRKFHWSELYAPFIRPFQHKKTQLLFPHILSLDLGSTLYSIGIWVFISSVLKYSSFTLGIFFAYQGLVALLATIFFISRLTHIYCTEKLVCFGLVGMCLLSILQGIFLSNYIVWIFGGLVAILLQINYTCVYANASHAAGKHFQGWAMGMAGGAVALSWMFGSYSTSLIDLIGINNLFFVATGFSFVSLLLIMAQRWRFHPDRLEEDIDPAS